MSNDSFYEQDFPDSADEKHSKALLESFGFEQDTRQHQAIAPNNSYSYSEEDPLDKTLKDVKPCPGLDGIFCGDPRKKGQGYCAEHARQYQRNRYRGKKNTEAPLATRRYYRKDDEAHELRCNSCKLVKQELFEIPGIPNVPTVCQVCIDLFNAFRASKKIKNYISVCSFISVHAAAIQAADNLQQAYYDEIMRRAHYHFVREKWDSVQHAREMHGLNLDDSLNEDLANGIYFYDVESNVIRKDIDKNIHHVDKYDPRRTPKFGERF